MPSIWNETKLKSFDKLNGDMQCDALVIGGGMAGLLTAYRLNEQNLKTVVIDSSAICFGQTKNTTAKITSQHSAIYESITKHYSPQFAKMYAEENERAISDFEEIINEKKIDCEFEKCCAYLYSKNNYRALKDEMLSAKNAGIDCYLTKEVPLPFKTAGALVFKNQAQFNPLKFINSIVGDLTVFENTPALKIIGNRVLTPYGMIRANHIVIATHYPFVNFPGENFLKMSQERSYVVAFENSSFPSDSTFIGLENDTLSLRRYQKYVLLGGGNHRTGELRGNPYKMLERKAYELFNNPQIKYRWSAQDCITLDGMPYIGRMKSGGDNIYIATSFNKWGMTSSMVSANIISDLICNVRNCNAEVFSPERFNLSASVKNIIENTKETVKGFSAYLLPSFASIKSIKKGEVKEFVTDGNFAGAYRDHDGKIYIVSLTCPHLKCKLKWNSAEKSWDCPCHGSRYDYKGNLIDNPAQHSSILISKID